MVICQQGGKKVEEVGLINYGGEITRYDYKIMKKYILLFIFCEYRNRPIFQLQCAFSM